MHEVQIPATNISICKSALYNQYIHVRLRTVQLRIILEIYTALQQVYLLTVVDFFVG